MGTHDFTILSSQHNACETFLLLYFNTGIHEQYRFKQSATAYPVFCVKIIEGSPFYQNKQEAKKMTIDEIYLQIAQAIVDEIKEEWAVATINAKILNNYGGFKCVYKKDENADVDYDFDISFKTFEAFEKLHKITTEDGGSDWNRAKLTLYPTGKFNVEFEWDQELSDEIASHAK